MMLMNELLNLCICYAHEDEKEINCFKKHIAPLTNKNLINVWYDREIIPGQEVQTTIDNKLEKADIICLMLSCNFLSSCFCMKEKTKAMNSYKKRGVTVVPIILSSCAWKDDNEIEPLSALPIDGIPIHNYANHDNAWTNVYDGLKRVIAYKEKGRNLKISDKFSIFLNNADIFTKAHPQKKEVLLEDIFIYPDLDVVDLINGYGKTIPSSELLDKFIEFPRILIAGEDQSGKSSLCKKFFIELKKMDFLPVYINDRFNHFKGSFDGLIKKAFCEQYDNCDISVFEEIDQKRIVPIIDDFHYAMKKERFINALSCYSCTIIFVDDVFRLNIKDETLLKAYEKFAIKQLKPSLRNELIEKWITLTENGEPLFHDNYKTLDLLTDQINNTLGKGIRNGIMPAYPFFLLTIITANETFNKPLDQEITDQGYCYQALIFLFLKKIGVRNDEIDSYINFLTETAYYFFSEKKKRIPEIDFQTLIKNYSGKFNLPINISTLVSNLKNANLLHIDSLNYYSFSYPCFYYFFVAKFFAEHKDEDEIKKIIDDVIANLHKNENAYITIFIAHHTRSLYLLDEILLNSYYFFDKYKPASLEKMETKFFDDNLDKIIQAAFLLDETHSEQKRQIELQNQDELDEFDHHERMKKGSEDYNEDEDDSFIDSEEEKFANELRRSFKTIEVMGRIIKNRSGSMEKDLIEKVFEEAMNVCLRFLSLFFEIIKQESFHLFFIEIMRDKIDDLSNGKFDESDRDQIEKIANQVYWNLCFFTVFGLINKIVETLGSEKLIEVVNTVCSRANTPASFLVKHGILMWYTKNMQLDVMAKQISEKHYSEMSKKILKFMVIGHCSMHRIDYRDKQRIHSKLGIQPTFI